MASQGLRALLATASALAAVALLQHGGEEPVLPAEVAENLTDDEARELRDLEEANLTRMGYAPVPRRLAMARRTSERWTGVLNPHHNGIDYTMEIPIGQQKKNCIMDTGSFELVVFSKRCSAPDCRPKRNEFYDPDHSGEMESLRFKKALSYGSGDVSCELVKDVFGENEQELAFWEATDAQLPILREADFQCIFGLGDPDEPLREAQGMVRQARQQLNRCLWPKCRQRWQHEIEVAEEYVQTLREWPTPVVTMGVTRFSICLISQVGQPGYLTFFDYAPTPAFKTIQVNGYVHWSVPLHHVHFDERRPLGVNACPHGLFQGRGCSGLIDSGTSLLAMPTAVVLQMMMQIGGRARDCHRAGPKLKFQLGDKELELTPDKYLANLFSEGEVGAPQVEEMRKYLPHIFHKDNAHNLEFNAETNGTKVHRHCHLAIMGMDMKSYHGHNIYIFGMPFLRQYYTTFDFGTDDNWDTRQIHVYPNRRCRHPRAGGQPLHEEVLDETAQLRSIDISKINFGSIVNRVLKKGGVVEL